jgi:hypothetical protein
LRKSIPQNEETCQELLRRRQRSDVLSMLQKHRWGSPEFLDIVGLAFDYFSLAEIDIEITAAFERLPVIPIYARSKGIDPC